MRSKVKYHHPKTLPEQNLIVGLFLVIICFEMIHAAQASYVLKSPDRNVVVEFDLKDTDDLQSCPTYTVTYNNRLVIADSHLGLAIKDAASLQAGFEIVEVSRTSHDSTYSPVYGERKTIRDNYNQLVAELKETHPPHRRLVLTFRAYNEGAAFCYTLPKQDSLGNFVISAEKTHFRFTSDHTAYAVYSAQGQYSQVQLSRIKSNCERPLTVEIDEDLFASVAEARLVDYARMRLSPVQDRSLTLVSSLHSEVKAAAPMTTPWRVIMLGRSPGELLERNYLLLNLNEPCAIKDTSWIKPGKVIREVTLTTAGGKACVDFAAEHNLQYVEFDAGCAVRCPSGSTATSTATIPTPRPSPSIPNVQKGRWTCTTLSNTQPSEASESFSTSTAGHWKGSLTKFCRSTKNGASRALSTVSFRSARRNGQRGSTRPFAKRHNII